MGQTAYFSKASATDFNDVNSWGTAADGTGTSPSSISSADTFKIANNAALSLTASAAVRQLTINSGSLTIGSNTLTVAIPAANNSSFIMNGGTLTISGGTLNVNGNVNITSTATAFNMSSGNFNVDGNSNASGTSVAVGTRIFVIDGAVAGTVNGGTITIVDPHFGAATTQTFGFTGSTARSWAGNTLMLGDGVSTDASSSTKGFEIDCYVGTGRLTLGNVIANGGSGTNRFATTSSSTSDGTFITNLTINAGSEFRNVSGTTTFLVEGDITNNGTLTTIGTLSLVKADGSTSVSIPQTISGPGVFRNSTTTPTANFTNLLIKNSSSTGVTFGSAASLLSGSNTGTVSGTFTLTAGQISTGTNAFIMGVATGTLGTFTYTAGGFGPGSSFGRWYAAATAGTTISSGSAPAMGNGSYPFVAGANSRNFHINRPATTGATGGVITVKYTDGAGLTPITPVVDGAYSIDRQSVANWTISTSNGFNAGTGTFTYAAVGTGIYSPLVANTRLMQAASVPGTHQAGTTAPVAQRATIPAASYTGTFYMGVNNGDVPVQSAQSGPWEDPNSWVGGVVPSCASAMIMNGHTITVSAASGTVNAGATLQINSGGTLIVSGGTLNAGCTNNNNALNNSGTLTVSGGTLNINGSLNNASGSSFTQSGGAINVDGNNAGVTATSVATGTPLVTFASSTLTLSGGTLTIVDPHAGTGTETAITYTPSSNVNATTGHTVQFGDGVSTTAGGSPTGFRILPGSKLAFGNFTVNAPAGTNRAVTQTSSFGILGNLTITAGEFQVNTGNTVHINGNIDNNGTLTTIGTLAMQNFVSASAAASTNAQTISGSGVFRNAAASPTANFTSLIINNSHASGVSFSNANSLLSGTNTGTVSGTLTLTAGLVNTGSNALVLGISAASAGTLAYTAGGFASGSTFTRWWGTATGGATITAGATPTGSTGRYPFAAGTSDRSLFLNQTTAATAGGMIAVRYNHVATMSTVSITDGAYTVNSRSDANWVVSQTGITGTPAYTMAISGTNMYPVLNGNSRITLASAAYAGTHQNGSTAPNAQRAGIPLANLAGTLYIGVNTADIPFQSVASGDWNNTATWNKGVVPSCADAIQIMNGHNVTVSTAAANCASLTISAGGTLTMAANTLIVGCTNNNSTLANNGTLTVTGGTLNINGNLVVSAGATFNQSGGAIVEDGNAAGVVANSVASGTVLVTINSTLGTVSGGTFTIVDPPAAGTARALEINLTSGQIQWAAGHTLSFGDGISTDASANASGFQFDTYVGSSSTQAMLGSVVVNGGSATNRWVTTTSANLNGSYIKGNLTINAGSELRDVASGGALVVAGDITNNGTMTMSSVSLILATYSGSSQVVNPAAQTISGSGVFRNATTTPTASFAGLTINNNNASGVTLGAPLSVSGTLTLTSGIVNTSAANLLTLNSTGSLSGGSTTAYINGPFARVVPASRTASTYLVFPVGKTAYNPVSLDPATTSGGTVTFQAEVFNSNTGTAGVAMATVNANRRWEVPVINGAANLTSTQVRVGDAAIVSGNVLGMAPAASGAYDNIGSTFASGTPNTLATSTAVTGGTYTGFFGFGTTGPLTLGTPAAVQQTGSVTISSTNNNILRIALPANGSIGTLTLTNVVVDYTGTSAADIAANGVTLWTGTASAPGTQISTAQSLSGNQATFSGLSTNLVNGTTYLWVRLNTSATAVVGNNIDAKISTGNLTITAAGGAAAPGAQPTADLDPSGNRPINYCTPSHTSVTDYVTNMTMTGTTLNSSNGTNASGYLQIAPTPANNTATMQQTVAYTVTATLSGAPAQVSVWVDFNHNGVFDASEYTNLTISGTTGTGTITVPGAAVLGTTGLRMRVRGASFASSDACTSFPSGETEDYTVTIAPPPACGMPTALGTSGVTATTANINWSAPTVGGAPAGYNWEVRTSGAGGSGATGLTASGSTTVPTMTAAVSGLAPTTTYRVYVQTDCGAGSTSTWAGPVSFTTPVLCPAPTALTSSNLTSTSADLNWTENGGATQWTIEYGPTGFTPGTGTVVVVSSKPYTLSPLTVATTYQFYVTANCGGGNGNSTQSGPASFSTTLDCSTATAIAACGAPVTATITSGNGVYSNNTCSFATPGKERLYSFTAANTGTYTLNVTSATGGYIDYMFKNASGGCGPTGWTCLADINSATSLTFSLTGGNTYFFLLDPENTTGVSHTFELICPQLNDSATGAVALTVGAGCSGAPYSNAIATKSALEPVAGCNATASTNGEHSVWFKFVAPPSGAVRVSTDAGTGNTMTDSRIALFSATNVADYSTFNIISCDEDGGSTQSFMSVLYATGLTSGQTYYVQVDAYSPGDEGTFCITVDSLNNTMLSANTCGGTYQTPFGADGDGTYKGWVPLMDDQSRLVALVRNPAGGNVNDYTVSQNVNTGAVRTAVFSGATAQSYLDRSFRISNSVATNVDVQFFFKNTELAALQAADPSVTLANLLVTRQTGSTCQANFVASNGTNSTLNQTGNGATSTVSWIRVTTPSFSNFYIRKISNPTLSAKVLLQGGMPGSGTTMRNDLQVYFGSSGLLPTSDPYGMGATYAGINNPAGICGNVADWVKVEIRSAANPSTVLESKALILKTDGNIVDPATGLAPTVTPQAVPVQVIVKHRNHVAVMSNAIADFTVSQNYDFTNALSKAFNAGGDPAQMVQVNGVWCLWSGEANSDLSVDAIDISGVVSAYNNGDFDVYEPQDLNLDGVVDAIDISLIVQPFNLGVYSSLINY